MTTMAIGAPPVAPLPVVLPGTFSLEGEATLPRPTVAEGASSDTLAMLMEMMQSLAQQTIEGKSLEIQKTQNSLTQAVEELSKKLQEAAREAAEAAANNDDEGFFGSVCKMVDAVADWVGEAVGTVAGKVADFSVDLVMAPADIIAAMVQGQSFAQALSTVGDNLASDGHVAGTVKGFTSGVTKFMADVAEFSVAYLAVIEAGVRGDNVWDALKGQFENLAHSFMENLVRNPSVMEVTGWALKGLAVATALASGGTLGLVSVVLFALSELNQRYGIAEKVLGPENGKLVSLGLEVASTCFMLYAGGSFDNLDLQQTTDVIKGAAAIVQGSVMIGGAIDGYMEANKVADEIDQTAETQSLMNRIARLQRMLESLIDELDDKVEQHQRSQKTASSLFQIQGATFEASVVRA